MKKLFIALTLSFSLLFFTGCASVATPVRGLYVSVKGPLNATSNVPSKSLKVGRASATSILGILATGDASIEAAARSAGITKIHHVDFEAFQFLGFYAKFTTIVYGE